MKWRLGLLLLCSSLCFGFSQEKSSDQPFEYVDIKEEFDLIVDFTMVNPECATDEQYYYSVIIGTTVIGEFIERISVLIPCLGNEFLQGDLISIKPLKTPKKNIMYISRNYEKDGKILTEIFGSEFRAVWGEVILSK